MYIRTLETKVKRAQKRQCRASRQNKATYMYQQVREGLEESQIKPVHPSGKHLENRNAQHESQC